MVDRLFTDDQPWEMIKDGNDQALAIFRNHYTFRETRTNQKLFVGPGEKMVLLSVDGKALFVWRKYISDDLQIGINCAVFRNEGSQLSSFLILEAEKIAHQRWPGERMFTYVDGKSVKSVNPGYCFKKAGWTYFGMTIKRKLLILEKYAR